MHGTARQNKATQDKTGKYKTCGETGKDAEKRHDAYLRKVSILTLSLRSSTDLVA